MAAVNPKILYNFNENSATTIRDYSENGEDGTGTNLVVQASSDVGKELVFDGATSKLEKTAISYLSSVSGLTITFRFNGGSATGTDYVFNIAGIVDCTWDGTTLTGNLTTTTATYSTTNDITAINVGTYYFITLRMNSATTQWRMFVDETAQTDVNTVGSTPALSPDLDIGWDGSGNYGKFALNEFKLFAETVPNAGLLSFYAESNGIEMTSTFDNEFELGDVIGANINESNVDYAVITYVDSATVFRIQPITTTITSSMIFTRCGHLWDTTRQWMFIIDDTPQMCFYDGISKSSEVLTEAKKLYCLNKDGIDGATITKAEATKTANYTLTDSDNVIYVDATSGAITITYPASPLTGKEYEIIKIDSSANVVTLAGNGNNINGQSTQPLSSQFDAVRTRYNITNTEHYAM